MATSFDDTHRGGVGIFGAGTVALLKAMTNPLKRARQADRSLDGRFNTIAASDPINSVLEGDIIPRLLMAHASGAPTLQPDGESVIEATDIQRFAELPLRLEASGLLGEVEAFLKKGVSVETIYLDMLAPAARRLGEMWETDECDFVDVTMGLWRLQEVMREVSNSRASFSGPRSFDAQCAILSDTGRCAQFWCADDRGNLCARRLAKRRSASARAARTARLCRAQATRPYRIDRFARLSKLRAREPDQGDTQRGYQTGSYRPGGWAHYTAESGTYRRYWSRWDRR